MANKQTMRYSDTELATIKSTFAENDILVFAIRKVFLQAKFSFEEEESLKLLKDESIKVLKKTFIPEIDPSAPLFQITDFFLILGNEIKEKPLEDFKVYQDSKNIVIDYIKQQFTVFENDIPKTAINLANLARKDSSYAELHARNYLLSFIDSQLNQLIFLAGLKSETVEQTIERLKKNSSK